MIQGPLLWCASHPPSVVSKHSLRPLGEAQGQDNSKGALQTLIFHTGIIAGRPCCLAGAVMCILPSITKEVQGMVVTPKTRVLHGCFSPSHITGKDEGACGDRCADGWPGTWTQVRRNWGCSRQSAASWAPGT